MNNKNFKKNDMIWYTIYIKAVTDDNQIPTTQGTISNIHDQFLATFSPKVNACS